MKLLVGHSILPRQGEIVSGDTVVTRVEDGRALLAVVDALGHGPVAAEVADRAARHLRQTRLDAGILPVIESLHEALKGTRGAAAMLCVVEGDRLSGCGVGNVDLRAGRNIPVVLSPGVLGGQVRKFQTFAGSLALGDRLVFFSDGISSQLAIDPVRRLAPAEASEALVSRHRRAHDDASVLVVDVGTDVGTS